MGFFERLSRGVKIVSQAIITHSRALPLGLAPAVIAKPKASAVIVGGLGATALVGPSAILAGAKTLIPTTLKGKAVAALIVPSVVTTLAGSKKARESTIGTGTDILSGKPGQVISQIIESESPLSAAYEAARGFVTEHPYLTAAGAGLGLAATVGKLPFTAGLLAAGLGRDSRRESPVTDKAPPSAPSVTVPKASPSAAVTAPPVSSPVAIPSTPKPRRKTTRRRRSPSGRRVSGSLNFKFSGGAKCP